MKRIFLSLIFLFIFVAGAASVSAASDAGDLSLIEDSSNLACDIDADSANIENVDDAQDLIDDNIPDMRENDIQKSDLKPSDITYNQTQVKDVVGLYGNHNVSKISWITGLSADDIYTIINDVRCEKYGAELKKTVFDKDYKSKWDIEKISEYIITDFTTTDDDYNNLYVEDYHPQGVTDDLVSQVSSYYGRASVSLMAYWAGVSCGEIKDTVKAIKEGKYGEDLKDQFLNLDVQNNEKIKTTETYIFE